MPARHKYTYISKVGECLRGGEHSTFVSDDD